MAKIKKTYWALRIFTLYHINSIYLKILSDSKTKMKAILHYLRTQKPLIYHSVPDQCRSGSVRIF